MIFDWKQTELDYLSISKQRMTDLVTYTNPATVWVSLSPAAERLPASGTEREAQRAQTSTPRVRWTCSGQTSGEHPNRWQSRSALHASNWFTCATIKDRSVSPDLRRCTCGERRTARRSFVFGLHSRLEPAENDGAGVLHSTLHGLRLWSSHVKRILKRTSRAKVLSHSFLHVAYKAGNSLCVNIESGYQGKSGLVPF